MPSFDLHPEKLTIRKNKACRAAPLVAVCALLGACVLGLCALGACATPSKRFEEEARRHGVTRQVVETALQFSAVDVFRGFYRLQELKRRAEPIFDLWDPYFSGIPLI